jgi:K+-transporting ATPase ATPase A chain
MTVASLAQYAILVLLVSVLVRPLGAYLTRVFSGEPTWLDPPLRPLERSLYRLAGVDPAHDMSWEEYAACFVRFGLLGTLLLYLILRIQSLLPGFDPTYMTTPMTPDLAMNTAVSFATTTTWQAYAGETTMSYLTQMVGLAAQNFLAGAAGLAVGIAFIRGLANLGRGGLGNFWVDLVRSVLWVLLPASLIGSLVLVWQGVPMNAAPYVQATGLEGGSQTIAQGPVAGLELIKNLGTNGGGFFNANGAHPYENPTPITNLLEMLAIVALPAALTYTFGQMIGRPREGWMLYIVMVVLFVAGILVCYWAEQGGNPLLARTGSVDVVASDTHPGGNMEGKEARFGIGGSVLAAAVTSNAATGSYNSAHDSYTPLGGMVLLVNMLLGELVFGGLGTGLYSIIMIVILALFLAGLMVGRTPEYLGKRIGVAETKLVVLYILVAPLAILVPAAVAVVTEAGLAGLTTNGGAHGFSEIMFAYASSMANNGQSFAGLTANSPFYNWTTALAMLIGRFALGALALALAGQLARQPRRAPTLGTVPTASLLFASFLIGTILVVGALSYLPALALGPIVEHITMLTRA